MAHAQGPEMSTVQAATSQQRRTPQPRLLALCEEGQAIRMLGDSS